MFPSIAAATLLIVGWFTTQAPAQLNPFDALAQAEARWQKVRPVSYEFDVEVRCFCVGVIQKPVSFRVTGTEVRPLQDLQADSRRTYGFYETVDKLFAAIRGSLERGQFKVSIEYDPDLGYPIKADLDPKENIFDDELSFKVTGFKKSDPLWTCAGRTSGCRSDKRVALVTSRSPWLGVGMTFGGFLMSQVGPVWWRVYWVVVAMLLIRFAAVLWKRLQLSRMAAGFMLGACLLGGLPLLGKTAREANAAAGSYWIWIVGIVIVVLALLAWESQRASLGLTVLRESRPSRFLDWFTLRHIPDLRDQRHA